MIDYKDIISLCPTNIQWFIQHTLFQFVQDVGITYLYTRRFQGRNQWNVKVPMDDTTTDTNNKKDIDNDNDNKTYISLMERKVPIAITTCKIDSTTSTTTTTNTTTTNTTNTLTNHNSNNNNINNSNNISTSSWICQNINWDKLSTMIQQYHWKNYNHHDMDSSTLDHIIATNYCYVMIHGQKKNKNNNKKQHQNNNIIVNNNKNNNKGNKKNASMKHSIDLNGNVNVHGNGNIINNNNEHDDIDNNNNDYTNSAMNNNTITTFTTTPINKQKNKRRRRKRNDTSSLRLSHSEDIYYDIHDQDDETASIHSMDAIELIRPKSHVKSLSTKTSFIQPKIAIRNSNDVENDIGQDLDQHLTYDQSEYDSDLDGQSTISDDDVSFSSTSYNDEKHIKKTNREHTDHDDMKWLDVGAKIGRRILESEKLHQVITNSQMTSNLSTSFSVGEEDNDMKGKEEFDFHKPDSPKNIAKPFHAMWTSPNVDYPSFDDAGSDDYSITESVEPMEGDDKHDKSQSDDIRTPLSSRSPPSKLNNRRLAKPLRGFGRSSTASPIPSRSVGSKLSETNTSLSSSDAFQLVPKIFDANRYLPPSMAIHHDRKISDFKLVEDNDTKQRLKVPNIKTNVHSIGEFGKKFQAETPRFKTRRRSPLLSGVRMIVPIFPAFPRKKLSPSPCYYQFATVISSKRINATSPQLQNEDTDCLSITVLLDKSFLRGGKFAQMTLRILDSQRHMPR